MQRALIQNMELGLKGLNTFDAKLMENLQNSLNIFEKLILRITGALYIASFELEGWKGKIPFYLFKCEKHGYQLGYPNGHNAHLICFECLRNQLKTVVKL